MLNIKSVEYTIRFLTEANFREAPEIAIFKSIFKRLKNILCINSERRCTSCYHSNKCLYNFISAGDFSNIDMVHIIIKKPLISKMSFTEGSIMKLKFVFLGDAALHMDFIDFVLKEFEVKGLFKEGYRFSIANRRLSNNCMAVINGPIKNIQILTPIDKANNIFIHEKEKIEKLNKLYNITQEALEIIEEPYKTDFIEFNIKRPIYLGANRFRVKGFVGKINFTKPVNLTPLLAIMKTIGAGKYYAIGGGKVAYL